MNTQRSSDALAQAPGPWICKPNGDGWRIETSIKGQYVRVATVHGMKGDVARVITACPDLLALAHQYASECGECAGARIQPDDQPCVECADIWAVIDKAERRA